MGESFTKKEQKMYDLVLSSQVRKWRDSNYNYWPSYSWPSTITASVSIKQQPNFPLFAVRRRRLNFRINESLISVAYYIKMTSLLYEKNMYFESFKKVNHMKFCPIPFKTDKINLTIHYRNQRNPVTLLVNLSHKLSPSSQDFS